MLPMLACPLALMSSLVGVVQSLLFLSSFLFLRQHRGGTQTELDIIHSLSVKGDAAFLISSPSLLSWWEFMT